MKRSHLAASLLLVLAGATACATTPPTMKSSTIDVWPGDMPATPPQAERPNFVGVIYSRIMGDVPNGAPRAFFAAAADDGLASGMPGDFAKWLAAGSKAQIHIYAKGQHGFGTVEQGLPVDGWLGAFYGWIEQQGFTKARP